MHFRNNFCHQKLLTDWPLASKLLGIQIDCTRMSTPSKMVTIAHRKYIFNTLIKYNHRHILLYILIYNLFSGRNPRPWNIAEEWQENTCCSQWLYILLCQHMWSQTRSSPHKPPREHHYRPLLESKPPYKPFKKYSFYGPLIFNF